MSEDKEQRPQLGSDDPPGPVLGPKARAALEQVRRERLEAANRSVGSTFMPGIIAVLKVGLIGLAGIGALTFVAAAMLLGVCMLG